jgi:hypothetical protein
MRHLQMRHPHCWRQLRRRVDRAGDDLRVPGFKSFTDLLAQLYGLNGFPFQVPG